MTEKPDNNQIEPQLMDTQWLLGAGPPAEGTFALEDILAEFGPGGEKPAPADGEAASPPEAVPAVDAAAPPEDVPVQAEDIPPQPDSPPQPDVPVQEEAPPEPENPPPETAVPPPRRKWWARKKAPPEPPPPAPPPVSVTPPEPDLPPPEEAPAEEPAEAPQDGEARPDEEFLADMLPPEARDGVPAEAPPETEEPAEAAETEEMTEPAAETPEKPAPEPPENRENTDAPTKPPAPPDAETVKDAAGVPPVSMETIESIMANTVDAVKEEQEQRQEKLRKRLEKARKAVSRPFQRKEPAARHPLPDAEDEPPPMEPAVWHKRRGRDCSKCMRLAAFVTALLWLPWVLARFGIALPFFSESSDNAALCVLVPQAAVSIISWPVFRAALEALREGAWSIYATASLCTVVTLLDEMTLLLLPERVDAAPLGGLAALLLVFALWGLSGMHRGLSESMRIAAMGEPARAVDRCGEAIAKGRGGRKGFFTRISMEDSSAQWQRLLLPVLAAASLVFAVLSSAGREQPQNLLWCWSVILCASSSLVFPLAYNVPFGRLAARLARNGAALAGQYGAVILASSRRLAVTDEDLFPQNTASLGGVKLYGEERNRAVSYAASLAVQGGGLLGRIFSNTCQNERISYQGVEHFHIHEDGGMSGIIHGETVLVGTPAFMRHKAVRLPGAMPAKTSMCLAVDGQLTAVFVIKYNASDMVEYALRAMRRNGMQITLAVRDGNIGQKLLKERFGITGNILYPELNERLTLSDGEREANGPNGMMYREGLVPFASLAIGSVRLCQTELAGNILAILSSIAGALLGFYLTFTGSFEVLTPLLMLTYMALWAAPMLPLVWTVDKL